jgi:hypothetical protein
MDGYELLKGTIKMSNSICAGCTLGGTTFQSLSGFLPQIEAEVAALEVEVEALRCRNSNLLRRHDPQITFDLLDW